MNQFDILFKEIEVADYYFEHDLSLIPLYDNNYFTESGDSEAFFTKLKKTVCDFIDKIITSIKEVFEKISIGKAIKKAEENLQKDPKLKDKKTKVKDWKKIHVLNKETQKKIQNAKNKKEVDQIMKEYKAKRNKILAATAAVTVTITGLLVFLKKGKSKTISSMEDQKKGMGYETSTKVTRSDSIYAIEIEETHKAKATADAEIRKTEVKDAADEVKEYVTKVNESPLISDSDVQALKDKMNTSAITINDRKKFL